MLLDASRKFVILTAYKNSATPPFRPLFLTLVNEIPRKISKLSKIQ
jgi:hypothetical protein